MHGITHAWHHAKAVSLPHFWGHAPGAMRHAINVLTNMTTAITHMVEFFVNCCHPPVKELGILSYQFSAKIITKNSVRAGLKRMPV
jgi:hypothetical protein